VVSEGELPGRVKWGKEGGNLKRWKDVERVRRNPSIRNSFVTITVLPVLYTTSAFSAVQS